ncbi:hypothetical protein [Chryseobacterium sp.]|uniref:hypothetical protein n=1 Tax=Chryseobacterium sp. TaxID=1871047 RepID=UPI0012A9961D|nr:hypothetical protein [Chryseobacterium sp.]QFG53313.1 hypothetical protein F7R58_07050 [Chryseobacterium sp.]
MNIKSYRFLIVAAITFIILFMMNYIGNPETDRLQRALMTAGAGVAGLTIGMWFVYRNRNDGDRPPHDFD